MFQMGEMYLLRSPVTAKGQTLLRLGRIWHTSQTQLARSWEAATRFSNNWLDVGRGAKLQI